jgi:hypothetical protein
MSEDFVAELYNGKSIALVGSSNMIVGSGLGKHIDSHDTVIRMNKSIPLNADLADDIGTRIDVLYHGLDRITQPEQYNIIDIDRYIEAGVKGIVASCTVSKFTKPYIDHFHELNQDKLPFRTIDRFIRKLGKEIKCKPNTGVICLKDLLEYDVKEVFLTGISFYKNNDGGSFYYDGYAKVHRSFNQINYQHNLQAHKEYMANLYKQDDRVKIDDVLEEIFKEEGLI